MARRLAAVAPSDPLFRTEARTGRARAALERGLRVLRDGDALEPTDVFVVAVIRSEVEAFDRDARRHDVSVFAITAAAERIIGHYNALRGNAPLQTSDDLADLVDALSAPTGHTPPA